MDPQLDSQIMAILQLVVVAPMVLSSLQQGHPLELDLPLN